MIDPRTLRGQLTLAYAAALLVALIAFAAVTLALVDRTQRQTLDDRLQTASRAISALSEVVHGRIVFDAADRAQFGTVVGTRLDGAIVDLRGATIFSTAVTIPERVRALAVRRAAPGMHTAETSGGENLRVAVLPVPHGGAPLGVALVWQDLDGIDELDHRLALAFAFAIPAIAAFAVLAGGAVAVRGLRPLVAIAAVASEIEAHDLSQRLAIPPRDDELGRLVVTFDRMLDRLAAAFERQRRFTSDASHDLRAPLSVIRAEADLALRHPRSPAEYERALRAIAAQADDLEALTRDLLAAARAESSATACVDAVDLADVAADAARRLAPLARAREVTIRVDAAPGTQVRADAGALRRAVLCLLHNALEYARRGGVVDVSVERDGSTARLRVSDDGPGFSADALLHATERFWRDDPARPRGEDGEASGTGLGLSIAGAIVEGAGGTLALRNRPEGGAVVSVNLPSAPPFMQR